MVVKIAARQSDLARLQAFEVGRALETAFRASHGSENFRIEYAFRSSLGDQRADDPLWKMPEKGVFTEDFVADILSGAVDLVVHSWKDLPIIERDGTHITATLARADARDVLLVRRDRWQALRTAHDPKAPAFRILTSSPRRIYNLESFLKWALPWPGTPAQCPAIEFVPVRGNIATRVSKLVGPPIDDAFDALAVAKAALDRLLTSSQFGEPFIKSEAALRSAIDATDFVVLPLSVNPAAAAQGALAIEVRSDRADLIALCSKIDVPNDRDCVEKERRELAKHGGGCHQKIGVTVLKRPYGEIEFVRGLTDGGTVLNAISLSAKRTWPKPQQPNEVFGIAKGSSSVAAGSRTKIAHKTLASHRLINAASARGYFIARADAWPTDVSPESDSYVWASGLTTWKKLCACGVWVHGSSEGLGEAEPTRLETLAGKDIEWLSLTHDASGVSSDASSKASAIASRETRSRLATYRVEISKPSLQQLKTARYFYWKSGSQFRAAMDVYPGIVNGYHATGPGHTHAFVRSELVRAGLSESDMNDRVAVFLGESDFEEWAT